MHIILTSTYKKMDLGKEIEKLQEEVNILVLGIPLRSLLQGIAHSLESAYAGHKKTENWATDVSKIHTRNENERRALFFSTLHGPLKELIQDKIREQSNLEESKLTSEQRVKIARAIELCNIIGMVSNANAYVDNYGWRLASTESGYAMKPAGCSGKNRFMEHLKDAQTFQLFMGLGRNIRLLYHGEYDGVLYPENLIPRPGETITCQTVNDLVDTEIYSNLLNSYLSDLYHNIMPGSSGYIEELHITIKDEKILLFDPLKVYVLLSLIARLQVAQIDVFVSDAFEMGQDLALKKYPEADLFAKLQALVMKGKLPLNEKLKALSQSSEVNLAQDYQEEFINKQLGSLSYLSTFDIYELSQWISDSLKLKITTVRNSLSILDFVRSTNEKRKEAHLNIQVLFLEQDKIHWLPNALAYTSPAELLLNTMLGQDLVSNQEIFNEITEKTILAWFKSAGFKVIDENKKKYGGPDSQAKSEFDVLAYKKGHMYHLEVKQTIIRNDILKKISYAKSKFHKAKKQLKMGLEFIINNKQEIAERLGLERNEEISENKIHSYIVSNSYDFDKQRFGGYLKFSIPELFIAIHDQEQLLCSDEERYLRHSILRFTKLLGAPLPEEFKPWFERKAAFPEELSSQFKQYMSFHKDKLTEDLESKSTHPLWSLENHWYTMRDDVPIDPIRYYDVQLNGKVLSVPT